VFVKEFNY